MMPLREEASPDVAPTASPGCAFQGCDRPIVGSPAVQLPPPGAAPDGQPLRVVFHRSPVCDYHRGRIFGELVPHLVAGVDAYCARRNLPAPDWDRAAWEFQPEER